MSPRPLAATLLVATGLLLALSPGGQPLQAGEDGKTVYTTYCSTCHGDAGKGDGPAAVALDPKPASFKDPGFWQGKDDAYLRKVVKEGGVAVGKSPLMAAWGVVLDDAKVAAVVTHIKTLGTP